MEKVYFNPEEWGVTKKDQEAIKLIIDLETERRKQKLSQATVAEKANISQGQLSRIENLECIPSLETISNIASALNKKLELV